MKEADRLIEKARKLETQARDLRAKAKAMLIEQKSRDTDDALAKTKAADEQILAALRDGRTQEEAGSLVGVGLYRVRMAIQRDRWRQHLPRTPRGPEPEPNPDLDMVVGDLDLSIRASTVLKREGIETIKQLTDLSESDLLALNGFGRRNLKEVRELLHELGLRFAVHR